MILIEKSITEDSGSGPEPTPTLTESHFRLSGGMTSSMVIQKSLQENQLLGKLEEAENEIYSLKSHINELEKEKADYDSKYNEMHAEFLKKDKEAKDYRIKYAELQETVDPENFIIP
jgi:chromosome segregation ATPase